MSSQSAEPALRRFVLRRSEDVSGISGTGIVAEGAQFAGGKCAVAWCGPACSVGVYDDITSVEAIHGHGGRTVIEWLD
jgi:hypothetical protein